MKTIESTEIKKAGEMIYLRLNPSKYKDRVGEPVVITIESESDL